MPDDLRLGRLSRRPRAGRMRGVDLRQLEYFAAVARHRHVRRAAEDLYVTPSAVSQQIRRLEAQLGLELLHRTPRGVELTPAGAELLPRAEAILAAVARARTAMDEHAGTLRGGVRVVATADAASLPAALAAFGAEHPGVRIALRHVAPAATVTMVTTGAADLAVAALGEAPPTPSDVEAVALGGEPLVLAVALDDPLAGNDGVALRDLRERPFVLPEPGSALRDVVLDACGAAGFGPVPLLEVGDPTAVRVLVQSGMGVALVPGSWLAGPGPEVGRATPAGAGLSLARWLLARPAVLTPVGRLAHEHLRAQLSQHR